MEQINITPEIATRDVVEDSAVAKEIPVPMSPLSDEEGKRVASSFFFFFLKVLLKLARL